MKKVSTGDGGDLIKFFHNEIDNIAEKYSGSPFVEDIIKLKIEFDDWFKMRRHTVFEFYKKRGLAKTSSFRLGKGLIKIRITFYNDGRCQCILRSVDTQNTLLRNAEIMKHYMLDVGYVYFIKSQFGWKIGKTVNINSRKKTFDVKLPFEYEFVYYLKTHNKSGIESALHTHFKEYLINGEWYSINDDMIKESAQKFKLELINF